MPVFVVYVTAPGVNMFFINASCLKSLPTIKSLFVLSSNDTVSPRLFENNSRVALEPCPPCGDITALAEAPVPGAVVFVIVIEGLRKSSH